MRKSSPLKPPVSMPCKQLRRTSLTALLLAVFIAPGYADTLAERVNYGRFEASSTKLDFGVVEVGDRASRLLTIRNTGGPDAGALQVSTLYLDERDAGNYSTDISGDISLEPGESRDLNIYFDPREKGTTPGMLFITHSGSETVSIVDMQGIAVESHPGEGLVPPQLARAEGEGSVSFLKSQLSGIDSINPTSIQFGPDQRLYVAGLDGEILVYEIDRKDTNQYQVVSVETIDLVKNMANHDDDGQPNFSVNTRLVTGIAVTGSASAPIIYVTSSDPRIGGGGSGASTNLDTNSSVLSRLTYTGGSWQKLDLVRGLPRSEENHTANGLALNNATGKLYVAMGGNTNQGAPSNNFARLPEYALSAAIIEIDLVAIGDNTYDLPTLDDEDRPGVNDANDPFGGNRGKNQAIISSGGPVQVYAPGFRNAYDVLISTSGMMYSWDNGPNGGWGGHPGSVCGNDIVEPGETRFDSLHLITGIGYYAGHPNPARATTDVTFNDSNPQSPVAFGNSIECDYYGPPGIGLDQHSENHSLLATPASTNGIAEYTASNFSGAMQGDLLAAAFNNKLYRVELNETGTAVEASGALFSNIGGTPLDVVAQGDNDIFPGTIWVADFSSRSIVVFEPQDYGNPGGGQGEVCTTEIGSADPDNDGFTTEDELANGTNACSAADFPKDSDTDGVSDLLDQDDDNDGLNDNSDPFALDPANGATTSIPLNYEWENNDTPAGFIANLGFSGLMTNQLDDYSQLFDLDRMTVRGAAGVVTVDSVSAGDAAGGQNSQEYGFQFGVNVQPDDPGFVAHTRVIAPFAGVSATGFQSMGLFAGAGDQDNYIKLVVNSSGNEGGVEMLSEMSGAIASSQQQPAAIIQASYIDLYIKLDPATLTASAFYLIASEDNPGVLQALGEAVSFPRVWLEGPTSLAIGIISTSNSGIPFPATWDFIKVNNDTDALVVDLENDTGDDPNGGDEDGDSTGGDDTSGDDSNPVNDEPADETKEPVVTGTGCAAGSVGQFDPLLLLLLFGATGALRLRRT